MMKRPCFTLLELLAVLLILALCLSIGGMQIRKYYLEQRFLSEAQQIADKLQFARDLMLILNQDIKVRIADTPNDGLTIAIEFEKNPEDKWKRIYERSLSNVRSIRKAVFIAKEGSRLDSSEGIVLNFYSGGMGMSKGELILSGEDNNKKRIIELAGYIQALSHQSPGSKKQAGQEEGDEAVISLALQKLLKEKS